MVQKLKTIAFDADDTLWHNEAFFRMTQHRFTELLADFTDTKTLEHRLQEAERRNLGHYGFGVKGFVLSMIETAIEVTDSNVPAYVISELITCGQEMLDHPIELLDHVETTLSALSEHHRLIIITKGDLLDQERKVAQSGLGDMFDAVEIVSNKTPEIYRQIFDRFDGPMQSMMVGNSLKSDVLPALLAGSWGVHVPHEMTWELERANPPDIQEKFRQITDLGALPNVVSSLSKR